MQPTQHAHADASGVAGENLTEQTLSWRPHAMRQGDGAGGWACIEAALRFLPRYQEQRVCPFGLAQMDNGELALVGSWPFASGDERTVITFSSDAGATWREFEEVGASHDRPMMLAYLGSGDLTFVTGDGKQRMLSHDYGRTWESIPNQPLSNGQVFCCEGNPMVDRDGNGAATRIAETGQAYPYTGWPEEPLKEYVRWSEDGGRSWIGESMPQEWRWTVAWQGKTHVRSGGEGALVRAANGWLVAALRTDMHPRYFDLPNRDDTLEGVGVSLSRDEGVTWTPLEERVLYDAGRHHPNLVRLPNGDLVMTIIVRADVQDGRLASYRRGCEAILSHDNGLTWDVDRKYILDEWEFYDDVKWFNGECGHLYSVLLDDGCLLTAYGHYRVGGVLIRWKP